MSAFDENPFADPSKQRASNFVNIDIDQKNREIYDTFDASKSFTTAKTQQGNGPAFINPSFVHENPQSGDSNAAQRAFQDFQRREQDLEKRAKDLERRETELRNTPHNVRQNNWPPLPSWCPWGLKPCFYQDIYVDIPAEFQSIVKNLYYLWLVHAILLTSNMIVAILYLFGGGDKGETFGKALIYFALLIPLSYVGWFRTAYKAFRSDSSINFMIFFFVFFCQFLVLLIHAMGIGNQGSCGFIIGIAAANQGSVYMSIVGVVMILMGLVFAMCAFANFYLLVTIHKLYRGTGASMAKAQTEFTSGVMANEHVQAAAAAVGREVVTNKQTDSK